MQAKAKTFIDFGAFGLLILLSATWRLPAQQASAPAGTVQSPAQESDPLAELSPENRVLFDAMREASRQDRDADVLANCKKLLPKLKPGTRLADFVTQVAGEAAVETGETGYALTLLKPFADAHPEDWRTAATLARLYAESGEKTLRDRQIAHVVVLHQQTTDPDFAKLHIFPIQKVKLHSGYAMFLYPFEPLKPYNTYLVAMIYTSDGKEDYRLELGSEDGDQAFFKAKKPGERRFSIDSYRKNDADENSPETQALHGFIDGVFDYDTMRDAMLKTASGEKLPQ